MLNLCTNLNTAILGIWEGWFSLLIVSDLIGNYPWKTETSVSTEIEWKCTEIKSRICSTRYELYAVPVRVCITRESYHHYPWVISSVPVREVSFILHSYKFSHGYCIFSRVLRIWLTGTEDMTHGYWGYDSRVLRIWLTGTEDMTHGYWGYDSRVLHILTGTEDMTHGYWWYYSRVMHTLTGTEDMTHGYWWYDSRVMHILTGTAYPHGYCI